MLFQSHTDLWLEIQTAFVMFLILVCKLLECRKATVGNEMLKFVSEFGEGYCLWTLLLHGGLSWFHHVFSLKHAHVPARLKENCSLLTDCSFIMMLIDKVPFSPCSPEPLPHCGPWSTPGWSWCPARRQDCVRRSPLPSPELQPSWPPCLQTLGWGGSMRLQNEERNWWSRVKDYNIVL